MYLNKFVLKIIVEYNVNIKMANNKFIWIKYKNNSYDDLKNSIIERTFRINSCFRKIDNKYCYKNLNNEWISFDFFEKELNFDKDKDIFCNFILETIKRRMCSLSALYKSEKIQYKSDTSDNFLIKQIELWLNSLDYRKKLNPIDISCYISFKMLTHHYFTNGNKRISILFLTQMLEYFHLFLSYSNMFAEPSDFKTRWYLLFTDYLKKHENSKNDEDILYDSFRDSILYGIFLDIRCFKDK